ncbi:hypothetical protein [Streptomyces subrutilus]|uniref:hypothetical protein n=1 Tax=Streptomyces subrutilus TaxID=36818 RepID=UPI0033D57329
MAPKRESLKSLRAARQLRRVRSLYLAGTVLWAAAAVWTGWLQPGSRQMWVSVLLLTVFAGLLVTASTWLRRIRPTARTAHAPRPDGSSPQPA